MDEFTPYPIYDLRSGLRLDKEPWLLPQDAFEQVINAYLYQGVLTKRKGYVLFKNIGTTNPITGITNYVTSTGGRKLLAWDTKRLYEWNTTTSAFDAINVSDVLSGGADNFIWATEQDGVLYYTNGKDQVRQYNGTTDAVLVADLDGDSDNDVTTCLMIFSFKQRLIMLKTTEGGNLCSRRARWSVDRDLDNFTNDEYTDAPTSEAIVSAKFIGDHLIVFFEESVWELEYTGDSDMPFRWTRIRDTKGSAATFGTIKFSDMLLSVSKTDLFTCDGYNVRDISDAVPDITMTFQSDRIAYAYATRIDEIRQAWWAFAEIGAARSNKILASNFKEGSWSIYDIPVQVFGSYTEATDLTWNSIDNTLTWDTFDSYWDNYAIQAGFPTALAGDHAGNIYKLNYGGQDNGGTIDFDVKTGQWNPFYKEGKKARLGWVDFLVSRNAAHSLSVEFYADYDSASWGSDTLSFSGDVGELVWKRVYVDSVAAFHQLRLYHDVKDQQVKIHAIVPYFKRGGRII